MYFLNKKFRNPCTKGSLESQTVAPPSGTLKYSFFGISFLGTIYLGRVEVLSPKIFINLFGNLSKVISNSVTFAIDGAETTNKSRLYITKTYLNNLKLMYFHYV